MILLDTHLVLWAALLPERLPAKVDKLIRNRNEAVAFSVATLWEVAIKSSLGREDFNVDAQALREWLLSESFIELGISPAHVMRTASLPNHHRDPFDRLLVAQALVEKITLLTADKTLSRYGRAVRAV